MNRKIFFEKVKDCGITAPEDLLRIQCAYFLAKNVHSRQMRDDGVRHFEHCRNVAIHLMQYCWPCAEEISAALIHDAAEDGYIPAHAVLRLLGSRVADLSEKLNKFTIVYDTEHGGVISKHKRHPEEYYGVIKTDTSACAIKIADRSDNLRSMEIWPAKRQIKYLSQTEKYILPLANGWPFLNDVSMLSRELFKQFESLKKKLINVDR